jgi:GT2 family glycosyltransferase
MTDREPTATPRVTVVVVGTNEVEWLDRCFASVLASETGGIDLRVCYVDNASTDGSRELVTERFPRVRVVANVRNLGYAGGNNVGMRLALADSADFVLLLNPDTQTPRGMVKALTAFMAGHGDFGLISPIQYEYGGPADELVRLNTWSRVMLAAPGRPYWAEHRPDPVGAVSPAEPEPGVVEHPFGSGSALFIRSAVLRSVGMFDEHYETYYEEIDLCRRARWAGWRIALLLDVGVQHKGGGGHSSEEQERYRRVRVRRNRYYHLLTDVEWPLRNALRLAGRWYGDDWLGRGIGFEIPLRRAVLESLAQTGWLLASAPRMVGLRRAFKRLRTEGRGSRAATDRRT